MPIPTDQLDPISRKLISRGVTTRSRKRAPGKVHPTVNLNAPSTGPPSAEPLRDEEERLIAEPECRRRTGLSRAQRWRLERDGKFPRRLRLGPRTVRWRLSEVLAWIANLPASP
jgi:prophage regulatory protein